MPNPHLDCFNKQPQRKQSRRAVNELNKDKFYERVESNFEVYNNLYKSDGKINIDDNRR
jgi:hypothetical protein